MRLFIAVNLPPAIREAVYTDVAPAREVAGAVKWVSPAALHVTLKFLGSCCRIGDRGAIWSCYWGRFLSRLTGRLGSGTCGRFSLYRPISGLRWLLRF